jgi:beta-galactosidase
MDETSSYLTGTAYFRPPNPPRSEHRYHLKKIKEELGFDIIRLRLQWNAIHQSPTHFVWEEYDEIVQICEELGLKLLLETSIESAPYWLERAHPECRYVSANGHAIELGPNANTQFGGYPGLCFHHKVAEAHAAQYLTEIASHFKSSSVLAGYDCWNEPHLEPAWIDNYWGNMGDRLFCYCTQTRNVFRDWLVRKYGDVGTLNERWGSPYQDWNEINPPSHHGTYADWLDWGRFWYDQLAEHMQWRYKTIKAIDSAHFVMSHSGAVPPFLARANSFIHNWKLAEPVEMWGTSYAPKYHNWDMSECAGTLDATRSAARGKRFWISEMSGGACNLRGFAKVPAPSPKDYRAWNWLAAAYGAKATIYWCYLEERTGPEAGGFGLVRANGESTSRSRSAGETASVLREYEEILTDHLPVPQVGILYDSDNAMQLFAMENGDDLYTQSHIGYYRAVWRTDLYARYITYDTLDDLDGLRVLIAPMCLTLPEHVAKAIAAFVHAGGVLIGEARMGLYDDRGYNQPVLPCGILARVVGAVEQEAVCSDPQNRPGLNNPRGEQWPDPIHNGPEISFTEPASAGVRARGYLCPLTLTEGRSIAQCLGHTLAVANNYGQGTAYYFGTYLGLALAENDGTSLSIVQSLLERHTAPQVKGKALRPRWIEGGGKALLAVFNDSRRETHREQIRLPRSYARAYDVYDKREVRIADQFLQVQIEPESVCIILVTDE